MLAILFVLLVIPFGLSLGANPGWIAEKGKKIPLLEPIANVFSLLFDKLENFLSVVVLLLALFTLFTVGVSTASFALKLENDQIPNFTVCNSKGLEGAFLDAMDKYGKEPAFMADQIKEGTAQQVAEELAANQEELKQKQKALAEVDGSNKSPEEKSKAKDELGKTIAALNDKISTPPAPKKSNVYRKVVALYTATELQDILLNKLVDSSGKPFVKKKDLEQNRKENWAVCCDKANGSLDPEQYDCVGYNLTTKQYIDWESEKPQEINPEYRAECADGQVPLKAGWDVETAQCSK